MRALAILLVPCAVACTPDFAAPSDVTDLRVLAVQAEPPEAQFDGGVEPVQVNVNILAVDPRNQAPIEVRAQLCAPTDSRRCDQGQPISDVSDAGLSTALALSSPFLVSAAQRDDLNGFGGIRVQYSFSIENGDPEGPVYGSKLLLFSPAGGTPNRNPAVIGLRLTRDGIPYGGSDPSPGDTIELPSEIELGLLPLIPTDICEEYVTTDFRGNQVSLTEQPRYSFFVTPGAEIGVDTADEPLDGVPPPDGLSRVTAHSGEGTLWIVVRDGRGGESWARFQWKATPEAKPTSSRPALDRCPPARQ
jgi:hypothetical protein